MNLALTLFEISKLASSLHITKNILETASIIYRKTIKRKYIRGGSKQNITAAVLYLSCKQCSISITLVEIATAVHLHKKEVERTYRFLVNELDTFVPPTVKNKKVAKF